MFHFMRMSSAKKRGFMALKLDMSKAYDRIKLDYLQGIMIKMGFPYRWVKIIMNFVSSVSYSFLVNGCPLDILVS